MAIDADRRKNTMQVAAIGVFNILLAGVAVVQMVQVDKLKSCSISFVSVALSGQSHGEKIQRFFAK